MGSLTEFLLLNDHSVELTKEVKIPGFDLPFTIRTITEEKNTDLKKKSTVLVKGSRFKGSQKDFDSNMHNALLVAECTVDPNFNNAELQAKYGVIGADKLIRKILTPGQYDTLLLEIFELNGFTDDEFEEKKEYVKNE